MKIYSTESTFDHPWDTVIWAAVRKYPNPLKPEVCGIDVIDRRVENGILKTKRILKTHWSIPGWVTSLIGLDNPSFACEYSELDPVARTMTLTTVNLSCTRFLNIVETLAYSPHSHNSQSTSLEQSTSICVQGVPFVSYMESLIQSAFEGNTSKGSDALEWAIANIKRESEELTHRFSTEVQELSHKLESEMGELGRLVKKELEEDVGQLTRKVRKEIDQLMKTTNKEDLAPAPLL